MTTVALTGATGFIGRVLVRHLVDQNILVKALYRPSSGLPNPVASVDWQPGSLDDLDSLRCLVAGSDAIVHCAGAVRGISLEQFSRVNEAGVANLLEASVREQVPRFLLVSSLAAREPNLSPYAASKKMGEEVLQGCQAGISWDILRPPAVYGPGDREMLPLLKLIRRGIIPIIGDQGARFSLIYVDDFAMAVTNLLTSTARGSGRCFELHDGHPGGYTWRHIASLAADLTGRVPRCLPIPRPVMQIAGTINVTLARLFGYRPMLSPGKVREIFHTDWVCDNAAITAATGWQPKVQFEEGMKRLFYPRG